MVKAMKAMKAMRAMTQSDMFWALEQSLSSLFLSDGEGHEGNEGDAGHDPERHVRGTGEELGCEEEGLQGGLRSSPGPRRLGLEEPREVRDPGCFDDQASAQEGKACGEEDGLWQGNQGEGEARVQGGEVLRPQEPPGELLSGLTGLLTSSHLKGEREERKAFPRPGAN